MDREDEVSTTFIISLLCAWGVRERFLLTRNDFKVLTHVEKERITLKALLSRQYVLVHNSEQKKVLNFFLTLMWEHLAINHDTFLQQNSFTF